MSEMQNGMLAWSDLFPNGRDIFYEGDNPRAFMREMRDVYGLHINKNKKSWRRSKMFFCPADLLDKIYGNGKYPLGS